MRKIKEFLEDEIEIVKNRDDSPFYDGVHVGTEKSKELNGKHILFCEKLLRIINKGDKEMEKSKMVEEMQELKEKVSKLEFEKAMLRMNCVSETARELFDKCKFNDIVVCEKGFENEKCVCGLNFDSPLDFAKSIIEHKTVVDGWTIEAEGFTTKIPTHERVTFGYDELIEIAEYLLIYCKHNKEDL